MGAEFGDHVAGWHAHLRPLPFTALLNEAGGASRVRLLVIDMLKGFATEGPLASPRVQKLARPIRSLADRALAAGVELTFFNDCHPDDAVEFGQYPPHCRRGTPEAELVPELASLPGRRLEKNALSPWFGTGGEALDRWRATGVKAFIVVGDCTDLCIYQAAMGLRLYANQHNLAWRVIVPLDAVDTYDLPVAAAPLMGAMAHDGDFFHQIFAYHMALNGVEVVAAIS